MSYGRGPPDTRGMTSLKVDNLTYRTNADDLRRYFEKYGDVGDVYIPRDRNRGDSRGFAFVRYYDRHDAEDAIDAMDGQMMDGREIRVQIAKYARPRESYRGPRGGGGYGRRGRSRSGSPRRRRSRTRSRSRSRGNRRSRSRSRSRSKSRSRSRSPAERKSSKDRSRSRSRSN